LIVFLIESQEEKMKRPIWIAIGTGVVVLLLAGAAFMGGRLLGDQELTGNSEEMVEIGEGLIATTGTKIEVQQADEMPDTPPDVWGVYVRREDSSLFVGTGTVTFVIDGDASYDGLMVEVVSSHNTRIYRDDTAKLLKGSPPSGPVQQVLKPGSLDEIDRNDVVSAWGERHGDRLVATVIVYAAQ
jgi:hypothetical protein